jgi:DNA repair protein RadA/Sms
VAKDSVFFGEAGLGGEIRNVSYALVRLKEAMRIGLKRAYVPKKIAKDLAKETNLELIGVGHVQELADFI